MAGKSDTLSLVLKKIHSAKEFDPWKLEKVLQEVGANPEFHPDKHLWMFCHTNEIVRQFAVKYVRGEKNPALAERLLIQMVGKSSEIRREIAGLIMELGPDKARSHLGGMIHSSDIHQRSAALDFIAQHERLPTFINDLKVAMEDRVPEIRYATTQLLSRQIDNRDIYTLLRQHINDDDYKLRRLIIEVFCQNPTAAMVEPFFERIPLEGSEESSMMTTALSKLARESQDETASYLLPMLSDGNPERRNLAVRLLKEMPDQAKVLKSFLVYYATLPIWLRERSMQAVLKASHDLTESLITLMKDPDDDIRAGAMLLAKGSKDPRIIPGVTDIFLGDSVWWIRSLAAEILSEVQKLEVTQTLISKIEDSELKYSIIPLLGKLASPFAVSTLLQCLGDTEATVRLKVLHTLKNVQSDQVVEAFAKIAKDDPEPTVREVARMGLQKYRLKFSHIIADVDSYRREVERKAQTNPLELRMVNEALNPV